MKIHQKLCLGFICTSILVGIVGCIAIQTNSKTKSAALLVSNESQKRVRSSTDMLLAAQETQEALREVVDGESNSKLINLQPLTPKKVLDRIKQNITLFENAFSVSIASANQKIDKNTLSGNWQEVKAGQKEKEFLLATKGKFLNYKNSIDWAIAREWQSHSELDKFVKDSIEKQYSTELFPRLIEYRKAREQELDRHARNLVEVVEASDRQMVISAIVSTIAAIVVSSLVARSILKPLNKLKSAVAEIDAGNLETRTQIDLNDEVGVVARAVDRVMDNLSQITLAKSKSDRPIDSIPELLIVTDLNTNIIRVNQATLNLLNFSENELIGQPLSKILTTEVEQLFRSNLLEKKRNLANLEILSIAKDRQQVPLSFSASIMRDEQEQILGIVCVASKITEQKRESNECKKLSERYVLAAQAARDGLWDWNLNTDRIYLSERSQLLMGIEARDFEISAAEFYQCIHPADLDAVQVAFGEHLAERTPQFKSEYRAILADGSERWLLCQGLALRDAEGKPYRMAGSQTDITERKQTEAQLRHQVYHDELTGLPNRILLMERLRRAIDKQKHQEDYLFALLFLDLDRFKVINDSLGHACGDRMLKAIASRLQTCLRPGDTIARLAGDEFTLLLEAIADEQEARQIAEQIQQQLALPFCLGEHEVITSASIGIAWSAIDYEYPEDVLRDADTAMHRAKTLGTRMEMFDPSMHGHAMARLQIEIDLRKALERQELRVFYQPIVSLKTGKITGFEALVRWQHPTSGMIPPIKFIPVAEETGLICAIGWWVLRQACQQTRHWQERFPSDPPLTISVNVSGKQFTQSNLIEQVDQILQETGLPPTSLKLEITESVLVENAEAAAAVICHLRAMGIQFSIDDFGTGYSSLSYLHRLPIDTLKIDRSFVNNVDCEPEKIEIIRTIVALAWNLGMNVVAEGVETKTQMYQLQALKSEYAQGYFFSKPTDSEAAEALLAARTGWEQDLRTMAKSVRGKQSNVTKP